MKLLSCVIYLAVLGIAGFLVGRIAPKRWFDWDSFPYRAFKFERNGKIYNRIHVKSWQNILPDMSRIIPALMPRKEIPADVTLKNVDVLLRETCVAEMTHLVLSVCGFHCVRLWRGIGGVIVSVLYFVGNLPYVVIQRYNRPRFLALRTLLVRRAAQEENLCVEGCENAYLNT